jgi:hypothetical protein
MAKADTYRMETGGYQFKNCEVCGEKANHRAFYYPTVFNGDAMCGGDFCEKHKDVDLMKLNYKD